MKKIKTSAGQCSICVKMGWFKGSKMEMNGLRFVCDHGHTMTCHSDDVPVYSLAPRMAEVLSNMYESMEKGKSINPYEYKAIVGDILKEAGAL
jgi:hypothetical protein